MLDTRNDAETVATPAVPERYLHVKGGWKKTIEGSILA